jgi:hypothetical protein
VNGGKWKQEKHTDMSGLGPLFSHLAHKLVQAPAITYNEVSQALVVEDVLLPKPFLDLSFAIVR